MFWYLSLVDKIAAEKNLFWVKLHTLVVLLKASILRKRILCFSKYLWRFPLHLRKWFFNVNLLFLFVYQNCKCVKKGFFNLLIQKSLVGKRFFIMKQFSCQDSSLSCDGGHKKFAVWFSRVYGFEVDAYLYYLLQNIFCSLFYLFYSRTRDTSKIVFIRHLFFYRLRSKASRDHDHLNCFTC